MRSRQNRERPAGLPPRSYRTPYSESRPRGSPGATGPEKAQDRTLQALVDALLGYIGKPIAKKWSGVRPRYTRTMTGAIMRYSLLTRAESPHIWDCLAVAHPDIRAATGHAVQPLLCWLRAAAIPPKGFGVAG